MDFLWRSCPWLWLRPVLPYPWVQLWGLADRRWEFLPELYLSLLPRTLALQRQVLQCRGRRRPREWALVTWVSRAWSPPPVMAGWSPSALPHRLPDSGWSAMAARWAAQRGLPGVGLLN